MNSISHISDRHVIVDRRVPHYLSFADVCRTSSGRLITAYREADKHVATRAKLLLKTSDDDGKSWTAPTVLNPETGHCPRLTVLSDGEIVLLDDASNALYWSLDDGRTWSAPQPVPDIQHRILDRILELDAEYFLTAGQSRRGQAQKPVKGQPTHEVMTYRSLDRGNTWEPRAVIAADPALSLCEVSMAKLADGRIIATLRENTLVHEPSYYCISNDDGETWTEPREMPLIGHRPSVGVTRSGKLLVTYRNVGPEPGTCAWLGTLDDLDRFAVEAMRSADNPKLTVDGLVIASGSDPAVYALRPLSDPRFAKAVLAADLRVEGDSGGMIHFGIDWELLGDGVVPKVDGADKVSAALSKVRSIEIKFDRGAVALVIDGDEMFSTRIDPDSKDPRKITFGSMAGDGHSVWRRIALTTDEPRYDRHYEWEWTPADGLPEAKAEEAILELKNARGIGFGDMGYSGWTEIADGEFICLYHHGDKGDPDYKKWRDAHILATRFSESDFG